MDEELHAVLTGLLLVDKFIVGCNCAFAGLSAGLEQAS
jgi:hypothetical protein